MLEVCYAENSGKKIDRETIDVNELIAVKGYKAKGKRITTFQVSEFRWLDPLPEPETPASDEDTNNDMTIPTPDNIDDNIGWAEGTQGTLF
jgi:hypothetical protein